MSIHNETFDEICLRRYAGKVQKGLLTSPEGLLVINRYQKMMNDANMTNFLMFTWEDIMKYGERIWITGENCPECDNSINGNLTPNLYMGLEWTTIHGVARCTSCQGMTFRVYHYLGKGTRRIERVAIDGIPRKSRKGE